MRIGIIAAARHPVAEPFAGGLEAHVWLLADRLRRRGHDVVLFAGPGSDARLGVELLDLKRPLISAAARADVSMCAADWLDEHHAYLELMLRLGSGAAGHFDVVHNHSLHHLPVAMAASVPFPMLTTLHTPPTPWLESALQVDGARAMAFAAVSRHTAEAWADVVPDTVVVPNGVDIERWQPGPGGGPLAWSGRIAPEKGTHLAIDAAQLAGVPLVVAGPVADRRYFEAEVEWRLRLPGVAYAGHLTHDGLGRLLGGASAALVTPCWDEPYGLVVAEAMACGTPVCAFDRGAVGEVVGRDSGRLATPDDVPALAAAAVDAMALDRAAVRAHAVATCSLEVMVDRYEALYRRLGRPGSARHRDAPQTASVAA
ncbi:Glycogen synthase [Paraconexibacter sp. AEG42_29]|uniref:Glycogen synthase n=1 Tax=Paraconexibacter sp. AEG42_29 TaxID=2997339 RepID=A0AAU7AU35_9ACTN